MAPFDSSPTGNLTTKLSTLIDGQLPDFIQSDHPIFSRFLKHYYEYLEAGELQLTVTIDNVLLEVETESFALDVDGNKIVLESGAGTDGKFVVGETITGGTSKATAKVLVDDLGNTSTPRLFITSQQKFVTGETVTGGTSSASAVVTRYRANPVQTIQQLLDYADTDNTIHDFLNNFRDEFMNAIPLTLADDVNKRNLIKNIRELYRAKGTSEGHKIFMRLLLNEEPEILYPNQYMMKASDGNWSNKTILRASPGTNAIASEVVGTLITGASSGASAVITAASSFAEGGAAIVEFELNPNSQKDAYAFTNGETITATSTVQDVSMSFTVKNIVSSGAVASGGALYGLFDPVIIDDDVNYGNGEADGRIEFVNKGSVSDVIIDDAGTLYEVGDPLVFTTTDSNTSTASGFVSVIDGSMTLNGTDKYAANADDYLVLEPATINHVEFFDVELETFTQSAQGQKLLLDGTDSSSTNAGHTISMEASINQTTRDSYGTSNDRFAIEEGTDSSGAISRIHLKDGGTAYSTLPTVSITTTTGTGAALLAVTNTIGSASEVGVSNQGFNYTDAPELTFRANFTLKDVTGTFALGNTLTTHTGTIVAYDSTKKILTTTFEDVVRFTLETNDEEGIALEDNLRVGNDIKNTTIGINSSLDEEDNLVTEDDLDNLFFALNADDTLDGYIILESGNGETAGSAIVYESPDTTFFPPMQLEVGAVDGTNVGDGIANEDGTGDVLLIETSESIGAPGQQLERIRTEESKYTPAQLSQAGTRIITNSSVDDSASTLIFDATDSSGTDDGSDILNEEFGDNNTIILDGTDSDSSDAGAKLLQNIEAASGVVALNGTNSSSADAADSLINQSAIDFFNDSTGANPHPTTITDSSGATAKIVKANIAKGTTSIATTAETIKTYGTNIESIIGEDLNRIQDSYYYQQFSYEVQSGFGGKTYLDQLKKAVHPAGFAVFAKVKTATSVSVKVTDAGSSLGGGYYSGLGVPDPDEKFSPILASTFETLFSETVQRRLGVVDITIGALEEHIILEEAEDIVLSTDSIILNGTDSSSSNAGSYLVEEMPVFTDGSILITHGTGAGESGILTLNGTDSSSSNANDTIILESVESITNNLVLDGTPDSNHITRTNESDDILLDGTDSDSTNAGSSFELEDALADSSPNKFNLQDNNSPATLLTEDGSNQQLENSGKSPAADKEISLVSFISRTISIPLPTPRTSTNGLVTLGRKPFLNAQSNITLEGGTINTNGILVDADSNEIVLEDAADPNFQSGYKFEDVLEYTNDNIVAEFDVIILEQATTGWIGTSADKIILNGTDSSYSNVGENIVAELSANAGDTLVLNGVDSSSTSAGFKILGESAYTYDATSIEDIIRPSLLVLDSFPDDGIGSRGGSTPVDSVSILLEESKEGGFFKQENETTASGHHGDDILLENKTGFGTDNKLILEGDRLQAEDFTNDGTIPFQNHTNSTVKSFIHSSDIMSVEYGAIDLEDNANEVTNILLEAGTGDSGSGIILLNQINRHGQDAGGPVGLEDHFDITINYGEGAIVLNGTDSSSTNAGDRFRFEEKTDASIEEGYFGSKAFIINPVATFDETGVLFDNTSTTFDTVELGSVA